jgi:hypothetical protein
MQSKDLTPISISRGKILPPRKERYLQIYGAPKIH